MYLGPQFLSLISLLLASPRAEAFNLFTSPQSVKDASYDFVIVGGGTAGCVLAARLTEDPKVRVLVVEAGGDNHDPDAVNTTIPFLAPRLRNTAVDWNFSTIPQAALGNRAVPFERGHVLGGSSSVNLMAYQRASNDVYDRWARITKDSSWSWKAVEKYYLRNSRIVPPADGHDTRGQFTPSVHGNGPVEVSVADRSDFVDSFVINAGKEAKDTFHFTRDLNAGDFVGTSYLQSSVGNGTRFSSAVSYLDPLRGKRRNLDVLVGTQATKLVASNQKQRKLDFRTVELAKPNSTSRVSVTASKEVILSAGVIGSPKILQLSGIGASSELGKHGIASLVELPDVGSHLIDHPLLPLYWSVHTNKTWDDYLRSPAIQEEELARWEANRTGLLSGSSAETVSYVRIPSDSPIFKKVRDPSAGRLSGHLEMLYSNGFSMVGLLPLPATGHFLTVINAVVSPTSRGTVLLSSSDPFANPVIDPAYLTTAFDQFAMRAAVRMTFDFLKLPAWRGLLGAPLIDGLLSDDEKLTQYIRNFTLTVNHGSGTARMSPRGASWGVVDPDLRVKQVTGLRVVDASIFPEIPETHTQVPVYITAERAADLIKKQHGLA